MMATIRVVIDPNNLRYFLTPAEDLRLVGHAISGVLNWIILKHPNISMDMVKESSSTIVSETIGSVRCLQESIVPNASNIVISETSNGANLGMGPNGSYLSWFPRYAELVEHLVKSYGGLFVDLVHDLNGNFKIISCHCSGIKRTGIYVTFNGRELIEYVQT